MAVSKEDVRKIAVLARLKFNEEQMNKFAAQMNDILGYVEQLNELSTDKVNPTAHILPLKNIFREDCVTNGAPSKIIFSNAPKEEENQFKVPQVIE